MAGKRMEMLILVLVPVICMLLLAGCKLLEGRGRPEPVRFTESSRKLNNPNRGFYFIHDFWISDEEMDCVRLVDEKFGMNADTELALIQICLQDYREGAITEAGLSNIRSLFETLKSVDKQLIVRFVYDREGKGMEYEPESLDIILGHMRQLEPVLRSCSSQIFILQGLFIGSWGEMNGTRYTASGQLRTLASQLAAVTDDSTYLAVRTPRQRRIIVDSQEKLAQRIPEYDSLERRMGLFNDGMLGNESDYGTYGTDIHEDEADLVKAWTREEELSYQNWICSRVPNGGEVITPNSYNDFKNAIEDLAAMHVTYLNREYDGEVLKKWENAVYEGEGCFEGMNGLSYIERHLGYRLLITNVEFTGGSLWENRLTANISVKNAGFAPLYREVSAKLIFCSEENGRTITRPIDQSLTGLAGGGSAEDQIMLSVQVDLGEIPFEKYTVYLDLTDTATGKRIYLANEQDAEELGYKIGVREWE